MIRFITQAIQNYRLTGAIVPSSKILARAMVQSMPNCNNQRILEVGAGTGAFTKQVLRNLVDGDEYHIVELNEDFCEALETNILVPFRKENQGVIVQLHNIPIEKSDLIGKFDAIICGLPFNNFPVELVQHLFDVMFSVLKEDGELVYFEYLCMRGFKAWFGFPAVRAETKQRTIDVNDRFNTRNGTQFTVWWNLPPCRVVRLRQC